MTRIREKEYARFDGCVVEGGSAKAVRVRIPDLDNEEFWIPKSLLGENNECNDIDDEGTLEVEAWFAEKEFANGRP